MNTCKNCIHFDMEFCLADGNIVSVDAVEQCFTEIDEADDEDANTGPDMMDLAKERMEDE